MVHMGIGDLSQVEEIVCQYLTVGIHKLFTITCPFSIGVILSRANGIFAGPL